MVDISLRKWYNETQKIIKSIKGENRSGAMRVFAFVGPSGTGKSYRAQMVAGENKISYIIDDGLLINENEVVAGK